MGKGKQESTNALRRQWTLIRKIPRSPLKKTAGQLMQELAAEGFRVEKRTVERDLIALSEIFPTIECDERERPFGWSWAKDALILHLPAMTVSEALAFQMIERFLEPLLPASMVDSLKPYLRASSKQLAEFRGRNPVASWTRKVAVVHPAQLLVPPKIDAVVHRMITEGLLQERQMEIVYRKRGRSETVTHVVNPLALVQRGPVTYFVVNQAKDPFFLVLHRISSAGLLEAPAQRPADFDLGSLISSGKLGFGDGKTIRLNAVFSNQAAVHLYETPLSLDQKLTPLGKDHCRVTATVPYNQQLEWWLLGFGEQVEVLAPRDLRARLREAALQMAGIYGRRRHRGR